jgi:hypothetical protein
MMFENRAREDKITGRGRAEEVWHLERGKRDYTRWYVALDRGVIMVVTALTYRSRYSQDKFR